MIRSIITSLLMGCTLLAWSQNPTPAPPQTQAVAIVGATAHLGNGQVVENAVITFANGKITSVGNRQSNPNLAGHQLIEATGKHVYPGFIAANSQLGLVEIEAVKATRDFSETGDLNPNVRSLIAYNTDSRVIPTIRSRGVLLTQTTPDGSVVAGYSSVVQLDAWNWQDAAVRADDGLHLYWPNRFNFNWFTQSLNKNEGYDRQVGIIREFFTEAAAYCKQADPMVNNLKMEAMCPVLKAERNLYIHADLARDIEQAVLLAKEFGVKLVIVGGRDSYQLSSLLRDNQVAVILGRPHSLPALSDSDVDQPYKTAAQLYQAGVQFGISTDGFWQQRNLPFQAGTAVAYGLPYEEGVKAISSSIARILGIDQRVGSLEAGKDATLFISTGDALDMRSSVVEKAFIEGRDIDLSNMQEVLYERFQEKYRRQKR